jgi:prophage regulatory protein
MSDGSLVTRLIRPREVIRRTGYTLTTIWRLERAGGFPKKVKIGEAAVAYYEHEIEEWIRSRVRGGCAPVRAVRKPKSRERFSPEDLADLDTIARRPRERL